MYARGSSKDKESECKRKNMVERWVCRHKRLSACRHWLGLCLCYMVACIVYCYHGDYHLIITITSLWNMNARWYSSFILASLHRHCLSHDCMDSGYVLRTCEYNCGENVCDRCRYFDDNPIGVSWTLSVPQWRSRDILCEFSKFDADNNFELWTDCRFNWDINAHTNIPRYLINRKPIIITVYEKQ